MKFLDERITFNVSVGSTTASLPPTGMYVYALVMDDNESYHEEHDVFIGNFYYTHSFSVTIDVTDIIRSNGSNYNTTRKILKNPEDYSTDNYTVNTYKLELRFGGTYGTKTSSKEVVNHVYRYPKRSEYNTTLGGYVQFFDPTISSFNTKINLLLQGQTPGSGSFSNAYDLIPHYPLKDTGNYAVAWTFEVGSSVQDIPIEIESSIDDYYEDTNLQFGQGCFYSPTIFSPIGSILQNFFREQYELTDDVTINLNVSPKYPRIAIFDHCPARYYLQWRDRFGSWQSQPFKDNATYSEDIENKESVTYTDSRRKYNVQVQPKWKINSDWITDRNYIYYESIFVSPVVILYDTKTDMNYEVIVKDNYIEKNYINQKGMVNLQLELEAVEKQNMLY